MVPTVETRPGLHSEQVTITKSLMLTRAPVPSGLGAVTIQLPARRRLRPAGRDEFAAEIAPAVFVRPIDIVSTPDIAPEIYGNTFDGFPYHPS